MTAPSVAYPDRVPARRRIDPAAGARDLRALAGAGYRLESLRAWDLFPHTHHVEMVAALTRA